MNPTILDTLGWLGTTIVGIGVLAASVLAMAYLVDKITTHARDLGRTEQIQRSRDILQAQAWWFNEDLATMRLIQDIGSGMEVQTARDRWRKARTDEMVDQLR